MHSSVPFSTTAWRGIVTAITTVSVASCSLFAKGTQPVTIISSDPEAEIRADGNYLGKGQVTVTLDKANSHSIVATKGNKLACATIDYNLSTTGILDAIGTFVFLVPALGFLSSGAWKLDTTHVYLKPN